MPPKPDQGIVRRDHDVLARHRMSVGLHRSRAVAEFVGLGVLVDPTPECHERLRHAREILTRMDASLIREAHAWPAHQRDGVEVLRIESQLTRQLRVGFQMLRLITGILIKRRVQVPVDPLEARVDVVLADDVVDRGDRGESRVPHRLRMGASESVSPGR